MPIAVIDRVFIANIIASACALKLQRELSQFPYQFGPRQLVHQRKPHRAITGERRHAAALVVQVQRLNLNHIIDQPVAHDGIIQHWLTTALGRTRHIDDAHHVHFFDEIAANWINLCAAFIFQRLHRDHPALSFFADKARCRNACIGEKTLGKAIFAGEFLQPPRFNARNFHGRKEEGKPCIFAWSVIRCPREQDHIICAIAQGCPDFGTIDDIFVAIPHRLRLRAAEVRTMLRLGKALTPDFFCGEHGLDEAAFVLLTANVE